MKDNLFEMLLNLFEKSLSQLQKSQSSTDGQVNEELLDEEPLSMEAMSLFIKSAEPLSTRVFTYEEQMKLTKASYQFLMRMKLWGVINNELFEFILNQLLFSDSRIVTLQETKWIIRNALEKNLDEDQLAFLDLVLYQSEDKLTKH